jgi:hypothetical protein
MWGLVGHSALNRASGSGAFALFGRRSDLSGELLKNNSQDGGLIFKV